MSLYTQSCYGRRNVSRKSLSILLHGVISLPDVTSFDKYISLILYLKVIGIKRDNLFPIYEQNKWVKIVS